MARDAVDPVGDAPAAQGVPARQETDLPNGISRRVHADALIRAAREDFEAALRLMTPSQLRRKASREEAARRLSGGIWKMESLRLWLEKGAKE